MELFISALKTIGFILSWFFAFEISIAIFKSSLEKNRQDFKRFKLTSAEHQRKNNTVYFKMFLTMIPTSYLAYHIPFAIIFGGDFI